MQERGQYFLLTPRELQEKRRAGEALWLMDIRSRQAFQKGHIRGSHNIPREELFDSLDLIPREGTVIVICDSGLHAGQAAGMLGSMGIRAGVLLGGMKSWKKTFASD